MFNVSRMALVGEENMNKYKKSAKYRVKQKNIRKDRECSSRIT